MNKPLRIIVVTAAIAGLLALGLVFRPARFLAATDIGDRLDAARTLASQAYEKAAPMISVQAWREWASKQDSLAAKPPPATTIVIRVHKHPNRIAALEPPAAPPPAMPAAAATPDAQAGAAETARLHTMAKDFEGCWQTTVTRPDTWRFVQGPEPDGWSPATYTLCLHHPGPAAQASVTVDTAIRLVSQWVVPWAGQSSGHTDVTFQSPDLVILRLTGQLPLQLKVIGFIPGPNPMISFNDYFRCSLQGEKLDVMATMTDSCSGSPVENCRGQPWVRQSWHQQLTRISQ